LQSLKSSGKSSPKGNMEVRSTSSPGVSELDNDRSTTLDQRTVIKEIVIQSSEPSEPSPAKIKVEN